MKAASGLTGAVSAWRPVAAAAALLTSVAPADARPNLLGPAKATAAYHVPRTTWGDPDLHGTWPLRNISDAGIPLERPAEIGRRTQLTEAEFAARVQQARSSDQRFSREIGAQGTSGLERWLRATSLGRRTSLIVDPPNGRLPPLTANGQALYAKGRSTWQSGDVTDWVTDLDAFERCITRGFPAVMLPQPYNNGIRIFQSPGFVVMQLETFGTRIIPLRSAGHWPTEVRAWHGDSRGHWEGDTLVIETTNIVSGDSVSTDPARRAAGPFPGRGNATEPVGPSAKVTERLTRTGPHTIAYRVTYDDPEVFTAPWAIALEWTRDPHYRIFEYACHEGNPVRAMITSARALRAQRAKS